MALAATYGDENSLRRDSGKDFTLTLFHRDGGDVSHGYFHNNDETSRLHSLVESEKEYPHLSSLTEGEGLSHSLRG